MDGASAAGKFFVLHSSFTKANIEPFTCAAKKGVSAFCENLLMDIWLCVNKNNALIYRL